MLKDKGIDFMPTNCSVIGVECDDFKVKDVKFVWEYPVIAEDI